MRCRPVAPSRSCRARVDLQARLWRSDVAVIQLLSPRLLTLAVAAPMSPVPEDLAAGAGKNSIRV